MPCTRKQATLKLPSTKKRSAAVLQADDKQNKPVKKRKLCIVKTLAPRAEDVAVQEITVPQATESTQTLFQEPSPASEVSQVRNQRTIYAQARAALRLSATSSTPSRMVGRDAQRRTINNFLSRRFPSSFLLELELEPEPSEAGEEQGGLDATTNSARSDGHLDIFPGALYICGRPGTGKTMLVNEVVASAEGSMAFANVNCTTLLQPNALYSNVVGGMRPHEQCSDTSRENVERCSVLQDSRPFLLVLDEVDHLKDKKILTHLFELASRPNSRLTVIGIANALNLSSSLFTDLSTAQLQQCSFPPYTAKDMAAIGAGRLNALLPSSPTGDGPQAAANALPCIADAALQLAAKKVAANTGDLRTFLSVVRKAIEITESKCAGSPEASTGSSKKASPREVLAALQAVQLSSSSHASTTCTASGLAHLQAISVNQVQGISQKLDGLGLAAKIALSGVCICLDRILTQSKVLSQSKSKSPKANATSVSKKQTDAALDIEMAWTAYNDVLQNAGLQELVQQRGDWENLLDGLTSLGLLADEKTRLSSPNSNTSKKRGSSTSPSPKRGKRPRTIQLLFPLKSVFEALRTHVTGAKVEGTQFLCQILDEEARRKGRRMRVWETQTEVPNAGFNGDGLEGREDEMIGSHQRGRNMDDF